MEHKELIEKVRRIIRSRHYSERTEQAYLDWTKRFIQFHNRDPEELGPKEVEEFLSHLATEQKVAASTQNQAMSAILFLYRDVLHKSLGELNHYKKAQKAKGLPLVLTREEIQTLLNYLDGPKWIMAGLLYGSGLRLMECICLRIRDLDFPQRQISVRDPEGRQERVTILPDCLVPHLKQHLKNVRTIHNQDLSQGLGCVPLPPSLEKRNNGTGKNWEWQYVFPSNRLTTDRKTKKTWRNHIAESALQKAVKKAVIDAGLPKATSCHTLRHSFAAHLLEAGYSLETVQSLLGHQDVKTTMLYLQLIKKRGLAVRSPLDYWCADFKG